MDRHQVLRAVGAMATCIATRADELAALQAVGFSPSESRVIADTLPEAFALPAMEDLGVVINDTASARSSSGRWIQVSLSKCAFFQSALALSREHRAVGILSQDTYDAIVERSALVDAVSKALNAGSDVKGSTLFVALIGARAEDFGFRPWYSRFWGRYAD